MPLATPTLAVTRGQMKPEEVPEDGAINLEFGDPGQPEETIGACRTYSYAHEIPIACAVQVGGDDDKGRARRQAVLDALVVAAGASLEADTTFGGLAHGITMATPPRDSEAEPGAPTLDIANILLIVEYDSTTRI